MPRDLIVVHGGGSFGHPVAAAHGISKEHASRNVHSINAVVDRMTTLHNAVLGSMTGAGVSAVSFPPRSCVRKSPNGELVGSVETVAAAVEEEFVPVLHGDIILHEDAGYSVASGDALVVYLAETIGARRIGLCTRVPGVFGPDGEIVDRIDRFADIEDALGETEGTDVTGGMAAKITALLEVETAGDIFGVESLPAFFADEAPGTTVGWDPAG